MKIFPSKGDILPGIILALAAMALANRVQFIRKLVTGA